jgi:hypothetical protein
MAQKIYTTGPLTDAQIKLIYSTADEMDVTVGLWQNTPAPDRSSFQWSVVGGMLATGKFVKFLAELSPGPQR